MFRKIFKSGKPAQEKPSVLEEVISEVEKPDEDTDEAEDTLVTKITNLEELVNKRTRDLEEAKELLSQLSELAGKDKENKGEAQAQELMAKPTQPASELVVPKEETSPVEAKDLNALIEQEKKEEENKEGKKEGKDDSFSDLFQQGDEEENLLVGLINSLPDVTAEEILKEAKELQTLLSERQQS